MCYLIRQTQSEAEHAGTTSSPSLSAPPRPRWIAGIAATLIGGLAMAALVRSPPSPPVTEAKHSAALATVAPAMPAVPPTAGVERASTPIDDGVPSSTDVVKAGMGHCEHGL